MLNFKKGNKPIKKLFCLILILSVIITSSALFSNAEMGANQRTNHPYVFVPGFAGWGEYDRLLNKTYPYWGRLNGDLIKYLNAMRDENEPDTPRFSCFAASVDPLGSAWERTCELYAQLTGTIVDYGEVHSQKYGRERYGTSFTGYPLISIEGWDWGEIDENGNTNKINLISHSFGGATARLLAELLANGSKEEMEGSTEPVSGLFTGGKADWIYSITTLAAPHNGTTLTLITDWKSMDTVRNLTKFIKNNQTYNFMLIIDDLMAQVNKENTGIYDLSIDGAAKLNASISTVDNIYYFSVPTDATAPLWPFKIRIPNSTFAGPVLWPTMTFMGSTTAKTAGGTVIDRSWFSNDGIVNTVSTIAPRNEAQKPIDRNNITPGIWNVMETYHGDHAAIIGGLSKRVDVNGYYVELMEMINSIR